MWGAKNASIFTFRDTAVSIALRDPVGKDSDCCSTFLHIVPHPVIVARIMSATSGKIVETGSSCWNKFTYHKRCLNSSQAKTKPNNTPYLGSRKYAYTYSIGHASYIAPGSSICQCLYHTITSIALFSSASCENRVRVGVTEGAYFNVHSRTATRILVRYSWSLVRISAHRVLVLSNAV